MTPEKELLVQAVKDHARKHYDDGGWDVIVECWSDERIAEEIGRARTVKGAVKKFAFIIDVYADRQLELERDRQADARNSAF